MNRPLVSKPWRPPYDYKIGAAALPLECRAAYLAKCKEWFDNNPEPAPIRLSPEDLVRVLRTVPYRPKKHELWRAPIYYRLIAARMAPGPKEAYIARCEEWFANNKPRPIPPPPPTPPCTVDSVLFQKAFKKYGAVIPIPELIKAGYTKELVAKVVSHRKWYRDHEADLDKEIERRWPGGKVKPKKVIKAVNKRMPVVNING